MHNPHATFVHAVMTAHGLSPSDISRFFGPYLPAATAPPPPPARAAGHGGTNADGSLSPPMRAARFAGPGSGDSDSECASGGTTRRGGSAVTLAQLVVPGSPLCHAVRLIDHCASSTELLTAWSRIDELVSHALWHTLPTLRQLSDDGGDGNSGGEDTSSPMYGDDVDDHVDPQFACRHLLQVIAARGRDTFVRSQQSWTPDVASVFGKILRDLQQPLRHVAV